MAHGHETVAWLPSIGARMGIVNTKNLADALPMMVTHCTVFDAVNAYLGREKSWPTANTAVIMVENCPDGNGGQLVYYVNRDAYVASGIRTFPQKQWLTTTPAIVGEEANKIISGHSSLNHATVVSVAGLTAIRYGTDSAFWPPFQTRSADTKLTVHVWTNGADLFQGASLLAQRLPAA
jgi:hypothetical protein